jgi:hypothetical protein
MTGKRILEKAAMLISSSFGCARTILVNSIASWVGQFWHDVQRFEKQTINSYGIDDIHSKRKLSHAPHTLHDPPHP